MYFIFHFLKLVILSLVQKYKNRIKDLENSQKKELAAFPKQSGKVDTKLLNRQSSKISNILHEDD